VSDLLKYSAKITQICRDMDDLGTVVESRCFAVSCRVRSTCGGRFCATLRWVVELGPRSTPPATPKGTRTIRPFPLPTHFGTWQAQAAAHAQEVHGVEVTAEIAAEIAKKIEG